MINTKKSNKVISQNTFDLSSSAQPDNIKSYTTANKNISNNYKTEKITPSTNNSYKLSLNTELVNHNNGKSAANYSVGEMQKVKGKVSKITGGAAPLDPPTPTLDDVNAQSSDWLDSSHATYELSTTTSDGALIVKIGFIIFKNTH